jgi:cyanophycin synthetase
VVVKPQDGNHGRGVKTELMTRAEIEAAYTLALDEGNGVLVERFVNGNEHRLLVVAGQVVAAAKGESASVVGDGRSTIAELIELQINIDPRRGLTDSDPLSLIKVDEESAVKFEIMRQGFTPASIPPLGKQVLIQRNGNVAVDVTDLVHPSVAAAASLAARIVGLDIAGVDLVIEDVSLPIAAQRGAIVEVNAGPGLLMHLKPATGVAQPVGQAIVSSLFPAEESGRIPIVGITGTHGKSTIARLIARLLHLQGKYVGLSSNEGLFLDQRHVEHSDRATWAAAHKVLLNRSVDAAVLVNSAQSILSEGVAYDRCQVGVVSNIVGAEGLDAFYIHDAEQVYNVLRTQVDIVLPDGVAVLNANDALVLRMAELCDGSVILFGADPEISAITEHRKQGGCAVFVRYGRIVIATGKHEVTLVETAAIPMLNISAPHYQIENVLAAVGAAWALGLSQELISTGIQSFKVD